MWAKVETSASTFGYGSSLMYKNASYFRINNMADNTFARRPNPELGSASALRF